MFYIKIFVMHYFLKKRKMLLRILKEIYFIIFQVSLFFLFGQNLVNLSTVKYDPKNMKQVKLHSFFLIYQTKSTKCHIHSQNLCKHMRSRNQKKRWIYGLKIVFPITFFIFERSQIKISFRKYVKSYNHNEKDFYLLTSV